LPRVIVAQRIEAVAKSVLVKQVGRDHGVDHAAAHVEALGPQPAEIVLGVVHDFVRTGVQLLLQPALDEALVEVAAAKMLDGQVS
jgi:hypothetical protein